VVRIYFLLSTSDDKRMWFAVCIVETMLFLLPEPSNLIADSGIIANCSEVHVLALWQRGDDAVTL